MTRLTLIWLISSKMPPSPVKPHTVVFVSVRYLHRPGFSLWDVCARLTVLVVSSVPENLSPAVWLPRLLPPEFSFHSLWFGSVRKTMNCTAPQSLNTTPRSDSGLRGFSL